MNNTQTEIENLNARIIASHNLHYTNSPHGLINIHESPNGNTVYHLYSTGEISCQKGGRFYLQRGEFMLYGKLFDYKKLSLTFPKKAADGSSYVILKEEECKQFRDEMVELIKKINVSM
jgi:hypothetical protein